MSRFEMLPGNILLLADTPEHSTTKHKLIKFGQWTTSINKKRGNQGESRMVHALIWISRGYVSSRFNVAEASGSGRVRAMNLSSATYNVFECTNRQMAETAAEVAARWAEKGQINYGKSKAIFSILHDDTLGKHGAERAMQFGDNAHSSYPSWGGGGAFCSEFVVACYQAAAISLEGTQAGLQGEVLNCDAKHCSVRALHDRLIRDTGLFTDKGLINYQYT